MGPDVIVRPLRQEDAISLYVLTDGAGAVKLTGKTFPTEFGPARVLGPWKINAQYVEIEYPDGCRSVRLAEHVRITLRR